MGEQQATSADHNKPDTNKPTPERQAELRAAYDANIAAGATPDQLLAIDDALNKLEREDSAIFELVRLRYFAGLNIDQAAAALGISSATAYRRWNYARAWLHGELLGQDES